MGNTDYDQELASAILEYLEDNGEVNVPELCVFQKTRTRITAYDYNVLLNQSRDFSWKSK